MKYDKRSKSSVVFVSCGMKEPKKSGNPFAQYHSYLNYGLLGLASILYQKGYNSKLYHGKFINPCSFVKYVIEDSAFTANYPIFLSLPSVFAIEWANEFVTEFKRIYPLAKIVVGGRWVVENDGVWIRSVLPNIDLVVYGTAENRIEQLLDPTKWHMLQNTDIAELIVQEDRLIEYPFYEYSIMPDFNDFRPSIEVSRGCGLGCSFCLEKDVPLEQNKEPKKIIAEIADIKLKFSEEFPTPYFESSFFRPTTEWSKKLNHEYTVNRCSFKWRTETRIDSLSNEILINLAQAGLKILDVGLESASISQIRIMGKSTKPEVYLKRAYNFLRMCKALNIWVKINILLYAGETESTINETISWLEDHKDCIKGVSVNPLFIYGRNENTLLYLKQLEQYGASPVEDNLFTKGFSKMNLSRTITYGKSEEYRISICKQFMTQQDYFDLKSFSYFPKSFTQHQFDSICANSEKSFLPFR